jgi:predicted acyl esterase
MPAILIDKNTMLPMRDGARLATDVSQLDGVPPAPVLVTRTPYDKEQTVWAAPVLRSMSSVRCRLATPS